MEDIKMKDLLYQWKQVLSITANFIWKWTVVISKFVWRNTVKFSKWMWKEIKRFAKGSTWITSVLGLMLFFSVVVNIVMKHDNQNMSSVWTARADSMSAVVDSIEVNSKTDQLMKKAGEYAMTPHHETVKITKDSAASLLKVLGAWYPDIILAQIQIESSYGTSNVAQHSNNVLGMKRTNSRKTTQIKNTDYNGYGRYTNWQSCIIDRVMWDYEYFGATKPSRNKYLAKLNQRYGGQGHYGDTMNEYSKSYKKYL